MIDCASIRLLMHSSGEGEMECLAGCAFHCAFCHCLSLPFLFEPYTSFLSLWLCSCSVFFSVFVCLFLSLLKLTQAFFPHGSVHCVSSSFLFLSDTKLTKLRQAFCPYGSVQKKKKGMEMRRIREMLGWLCLSLCLLPCLCLCISLSCTA